MRAAARSSVRAASGTSAVSARWGPCAGELAGDAAFIAGGSKATSGGAVRRRRSSAHDAPAASKPTSAATHGQSVAPRASGSVVVAVTGTAGGDIGSGKFGVAAVGWGSGGALSAACVGRAAVSASGTSAWADGRGAGLAEGSATGAAGDGTGAGTGTATTGGDGVAPDCPVVARGGGASGTTGPCAAELGFSDGGNCHVVASCARAALAQSASAAAEMTNDPGNNLIAGA